MSKTGTPLGQLPSTIPADADAPDVNGDMGIQLTAVERRLNMSFADRATRTTTITTPVDGMVTYIQNVNEIDTRIGGQWVKTWPTKYSGTAAPSNSLGGIGDVYFQYT